MIDFRLPTALFGGSFDPVHVGHLHVGRSVLTALPDIKQLVFVPASQSPGKHPACASGEHRLEWLKLAVEPEGHRVWDTDLRRGGESFTVETLEEAHARGARRASLYWILGADAYNAFEQWRKPARIRELCRLIIVNRPGNTLEARKADDLIIPIPPHPASSSELRKELAEGRTGSPWLPGPVRGALEKLLPLENPYVRKN